VPAARVCYYAITRDAAGNVRVRYGASRRAEAQIIATLERWLRICQNLEADGYRLVRSDDGNEAGSAR
jgi:hypothetical protein